MYHGKLKDINLNDFSYKEKEEFLKRIINNLEKTKNEKEWIEAEANVAYNIFKNRDHSQPTSSKKDKELVEKACDFLTSNF